MAKGPRDGHDTVEQDERVVDVIGPAVVGRPPEARVHPPVEVLVNGGQLVRGQIEESNGGDAMFSTYFRHAD